MDKYNYYDNLKKYKKNYLQHAKSKLYWIQQDDHQYYKRIGEPGNYRYFYSKDQWDAYQKERAGMTGYEDWKKNQDAKETAKEKADMTGYDSWKKEEDKKKRLEKQKQQQINNNAEADKHTGDRYAKPAYNDPMTNFEFKYDPSKLNTDVLTQITAGVQATEDTNKIKEEVQKNENEIIKEIDNYMNKYMKNISDYSYTINYTDELRNILKETPEYKYFLNDIKKRLTKSQENGHWPDFEEFWSQVANKKEEIGKKYFKENDNNKDSVGYLIDEFKIAAENGVYQDIVKIWNSKIEEANKIAEETKQRKERLKNRILTSDEAKEVGKIRKELSNFDDNDKGGNFKFGSDKWEDRWKVYYKEVKKLAQQLKDNDTNNIYNDFTVDEIYNIFRNNEYNLSHNIDPYGYTNQKTDQIKGQIYIQNANKTEESVQKAIATDVHFLENDLIDLTNYSGSKRTMYELPRAYGGNMSQGMKDKCKDLDVRLKNIRQEEMHDPETGLPIKAYETTFKQDLALVNYNRQAESVINTSWEYSYNCSACTIAMCLRMKGYDVSANPRGSDELMWSSGDRWNTFKDVTHSGEYNDKTEFMNMVSEQPVGSYGDISVNWLTDSGHSMFYRIADKGEFQIWDSQLNVRVDVDDLLDRSKDWKITRLDNKEVNGYVARNTGWAKYY